MFRLPLEEEPIQLKSLREFKENVLRFINHE